MPPLTLPTSRQFIKGLLTPLPALPLPSIGATNAAPSNPLNSAPEEAKKQLLALHVLFPNEFLPALDLLDRRLVSRLHIRNDPGDNATDAAPQAGNVADSNSTTEPRGRGQVEDSQAVARIIGEDMERPGETSTPNFLMTRAVGQMDPVPPMEESEEARVGQVESGLAAPLHDTSEEEDTVYYVRSAQQRSSRYSNSYDSTTTYEVRLTAWNCSCPAFAFAAFPSVHPEPPVALYESIEGNGQQDGGWSFGGMSLGDGIPPVCKHLLACVLVERCVMFSGFVEEREVSVEEAAGWAAGWGD